MSLVDTAVATLCLNVILLHVGTHWRRYGLPAIAGGVEWRLGTAHAVRMTRGIDLNLHLLDRAASWTRWQLLLSTGSAQDDRRLGQPIEVRASSWAGQIDG